MTFDDQDVRRGLRHLTKLLLSRAVLPYLRAVVAHLDDYGREDEPAAGGRVILKRRTTRTEKD